MRKFLLEFIYVCTFYTIPVIYTEDHSEKKSWKFKTAEQDNSAYIIGKVFFWNIFILTYVKVKFFL